MQKTRRTRTPPRRDPACRQAHAATASSQGKTFPKRHRARSRFLPTTLGVERNLCRSARNSNRSKPRAVGSAENDTVGTGPSSQRRTASCETVATLVPGRVCKCQRLPQALQWRATLLPVPRLNRAYQASQGKFYACKNSDPKFYLPDSRSCGRPAREEESHLRPPGNGN